MKQQVRFFGFLTMAIGFAVMGCINPAASQLAVVTPPAPSSEKALTAFGLQLTQLTSAEGSINEGAKTIALSVPIGTTVTALSPTISTTGESVSPTPGTAQDFTAPVTYTVTAEDGSTMDYTVTVTELQLAVGDNYSGGKIGYILQLGDLGYAAAVQHGLIVATVDQSAAINWAIVAKQSALVGTVTAIGTGSANTDKIIFQNGSGSSYAAGLARAYTGGGYSDWYLPSIEELGKLYLNRVAIGGFSTGYFWSSSELDAANVKMWSFSLTTPGQGDKAKSNSKGNVRAVRAF
jgi:hypothetical protein